MEALISRTPPQFRVALRTSVLVTLVVLLLYLASVADSDGLGLNLAHYWSSLCACLGQGSLLWRLVVSPGATTEHLHLQTVALLGVSFLAREVELAASGDEFKEFNYNGLAAFLSILSVVLGIRHRRRRAVTGEDEPSKAYVLAGRPFAEELFMFVEAPSFNSGWRKQLSLILRYCLLPLAAVAVALLMELAILSSNFVQSAFLTTAPASTPHSTAAANAAAANAARVSSSSTSMLAGGPTLLFLSSCRSVLASLALLPQLQVLLVCRKESQDDIVVPSDLRYWLVSTGIGHLFPLMMAIYLASFGKGGARAALLGCQEAFSTLVLAELLVAHFAAKCSGKKQLVLPV